MYRVGLLGAKTEIQVNTIEQIFQESRNTVNSHAQPTPGLCFHLRLNEKGGPL